MSNLSNPRLIPFLSCWDLRTGTNRRRMWTGETEIFYVHGMPPEAFRGDMSFELLPEAKIYPLDGLPTDVEKNECVRIVCFKKHNILEGL